MRLDMFLKTSRLIARRSLAQEFCNTGLVRVNGSPAKSAKEVSVGDEIEIDSRRRRMKIVVVEVPTTKQVSKQQAASLFRVLEETEVDDDPLSSGSR